MDDLSSRIASLGSSEAFVRKMKSLRLGPEEGDKTTLAELDRLHKMAYCDELTGIPNRRYFKEELDCMIQLGKSLDQQFAVIFLDMDKFKYINDTYGHEAGDFLLKQVALRLQYVIRLRYGGFVARLGGDEFTGIVSFFNEQELTTIIQELLHELRKAYEFNGTILDSTPSIGISLYPTHGDLTEVLMKKADEAMYVAKTQGKNTYRFYTENRL